MRRVEYPNAEFLTDVRAHRRDAKAQPSVVDVGPEAAVLRTAFVGDIQVAEHLEDINDRQSKLGGNRIEGNQISIDPQP